MERHKDSSNNDFINVPLGWDAPEFQLRVTLINRRNTIRLNKIDEKNHVSPGPEFDLEHVPKLIEALIHFYNLKKGI